MHIWIHLFHADTLFLANRLINSAICEDKLICESVLFLPGKISLLTNRTILANKLVLANKHIICQAPSSRLSLLIRWQTDRPCIVSRHLQVAPPAGGQSPPPSSCLAPLLPTNRPYVVSHSQLPSPAGGQSLPSSSCLTAHLSIDKFNASANLHLPRLVSSCRKWIKNGQ